MRRCWTGALLLVIGLGAGGCIFDMDGSLLNKKDVGAADLKGRDRGRPDARRDSAPPLEAAPDLAPSEAGGDAFPVEAGPDAARSDAGAG